MTQSVSSVSEIPVLLICVLLVWAAWSDIRHRVLPNWTALAILVAALIGVVANSGFDALGSHLGHFALALVIGFGLFAIRWIGGGDAKTYAALAAAVPLSQGFTLLIYTCFAMILVSLIWISKHRFARRRADSGTQDLSQMKFAKIPLGVAIAAGGIALFARDFAQALAA